MFVRSTTSNERDKTIIEDKTKRQDRHRTRSRSHNRDKTTKKTTRLVVSLPPPPPSSTTDCSFFSSVFGLLEEKRQGKKARPADQTRETNKTKTKSRQGTRQDHLKTKQDRKHVLSLFVPFSLTVPIIFLPPEKWMWFNPGCLKSFCLCPK